MSKEKVSPELLSSILVSPGEYPSGLYFRSDNGYLGVFKKSTRVEKPSRWMKYYSRDIKQLIFVSYIIRIRVRNTFDRGMLVEIEKVADLLPISALLLANSMTLWV